MEAWTDFFVATAIGLEVPGSGLLAWWLHLSSGRTTLRGGRARGRPLREAVQVIALGQAQNGEFDV